MNYSKIVRKKNYMPSKTTINWLFNDIWCYLFIACFDWKIDVFQQTVVRVYYNLNSRRHFSLFLTISHSLSWKYGCRGQHIFLPNPDILQKIANKKVFYCFHLFICLWSMESYLLFSWTCKELSGYWFVICFSGL